MDPSVSAQHPPYWNILSLVIPGVAFVVGILVLLANRSRDYAGGISQVLLFAVVMSAFGVLGEAAAITSFYKRERLAGLSALGALLNFTLLIPGLLFFIYKLRD